MPPSTRLPLFPSEKDLDHEPLLPLTSGPGLPLRTPIRQRVLRRCLTLLVASLCLFATIRLVEILHLYADPGTYDSFPSKPLVPSPYDLEPLVPPFQNGSLSFIQSQLDHRLASLELDAPSTLSCPSLATSSELQARYTHLRSRGPTLIAINLFESDAVIPSLFRAILDVAAFLPAELLHVSIFENGSQDHTATAMAHLAAALTRAGITHSISSDPRSTAWADVDRIEQLAQYRNVVIEEVAKEGRTAPFESVVYINDVFTCARDVLELMHQRIVQDAHATCGLDWMAKKSILGGLVGNTGPTFYDNWVSRSISGNTIRPRFDPLTETRSGILELFNSPSSPSSSAPSSLVPSFLRSIMTALSSSTSDPELDLERESRERFRAGLPVAVYSCWNGMIAMDARPFRDAVVQVEGELFKEEGLVFRGADRTGGECAASECKLIAKDFWARGFDRWVLVPSVRVTYEQSLHSHSDLVALSTLPSPADAQQNELIEWKTVPRPEEVVCYAYHGAGKQGIEWPWMGVWESMME